jgi:hypothetical protein
MEVLLKKMGIAALVAAVFTVAAAWAFGFGTAKDLRQYPDCLNCGMSRKACAHTRLTVEYNDGTKRAECSLHCLVADLVNQPRREPKTLLAADYHDKSLAPAEKCWWVRYDNAVACRGSKVMLAFRTEGGANRFLASFGGKKLTFDDALKLTYLDLERDWGPEVSP